MIHSCLALEVNKDGATPENQSSFDHGIDKLIGQEATAKH